VGAEVIADEYGSVSLMRAGHAHACPIGTAVCIMLEPQAPHAMCA
jgi:hypothetical protein